MGAILASPIRVMDQSLFRAFHGYSLKQGFGYQALCYTWSHSLTHYRSGVQTLVSSKIKPTLISGNIGNISNPYPTSGRSLEPLSQEIVSDREIMSGVGSYSKPTVLYAAQAQFPADAFYTM